MRFRVERDQLADAVAWAARPLPQRPAMPVLSGLLLDVTGHLLQVSGFDFEVFAAGEVDVAAAEAGRVLVPGRLLAEITRSLPAHPVEVSTDGSRVLVSCGTTRFTLPTLPVEDYPSLPEMPQVSGSVEADVFAHAVSSVAVAAGRDDTLPVLTGVRMEIAGDRITLVATDRYRLAVRELSWTPASPGLAATALVPARTLADAARNLTGGAEVAMALGSGGAGEGLVGFVGGSRRTTTRLLDGEFPKYAGLFPAQHDATAEVDTAPLADAVKRVALVASRTDPVRLAFTDGEVTLEAGRDDALAAESLPVSYDGEAMTVAFNATYLLDGLAALGADVTRLSFTTPTKPVVLTGKEGDDYRYLLMPVRLNG